MPEYKNPQSEPGMERRFLLVFLLMAVVIFGSQLLMRKYMPQQPPSTARPNQPVDSKQSQSPQAQPAPVPVLTGTALAPKSRPAQPASTREATSESETVVENGFYRITFTNRGAQVRSWLLKKFSDDQGRPLDLVNTAASAKYGYPLSLWTYDEGLRNKLNSALYVPSEIRPADPLAEEIAKVTVNSPKVELAGETLNAPAAIVFEYSDSSLTVRKTFDFDHSYVVRVQTSVFENGSPVYAFPSWPAGFGDQTTLPAYASSQFEYQLNNDTEHAGIKKISGGNTLHGAFDWVGVSSSYFGAIFIPDGVDNLTVVTLRGAIEIPTDPSKPNETKPADVLGIAVGRPGEPSERLFVGPKSLEVLEAVPVPATSGADKDLRSLVHFGWFGPIARPLFIWLRWTNKYVHNWGWAIVLQTFIITLAMLPLRITQMKSALKMQKAE